jgi:hypothetical protein
MIRTHDGKTLINPRYVVALQVEQDIATLKWVVNANVQNYMGKLVLGVFDSALDAEQGASRVARFVDDTNSK